VRLLDLFCGAGGATRGYQEAGFYVVGVDIEPQPNYCGDEFEQADALQVLHLLDPREFDAIHASPPCQRYSKSTAWRGDRQDHPDLIAPVRDALNETGLPWVIENVRQAPISACFMLCGSMFNLGMRRHRFFETNWAPLILTQPCQHNPATDMSHDHGKKQSEAR